MHQTPPHEPSSNLAFEWAYADKAIGLLAILAAFSALIAFCLAVYQAPTVIENDCDLAPTFAVAHGYKLYYGREEGPILNTIYGPIAALAYAPTLLSATPMTAVRLATITTIVLVFFPMFVIAKEKGVQLDWRVFFNLLGLGAALTFLSSSLGMVSILIHADAPALAAGALACWLSGANGVHSSWQRTVLAGVFAAVAVLSKQNMVPLALALTLWWLIISAKRVFFFAAGFLTSLLAIVSGTLLLSTTPGAAWFNWFQIPTHQPYDKAILFPVVDSLARTLLLYALPAATGVWMYLRQQPEKLTWSTRLSPLSVLLLWAGCWLIPTSVLGRIKLGGSENALSPAVYFFALACLRELSAAFLGSEAKSSRRKGSVALALVLGTYVAIKLPENVYSLFKASNDSRMEQVYNYSRSKPGQVYFPQFPLTILMAEGRLYNFSWGLTDRRLAGFPVSRRQFLRHVPSSTNRMALAAWVPLWDEDITSRCKHGTESSDPELPGFTVCEFR